MLRTNRIDKQTLCSLHFMIFHARRLQILPVKITCKSLEAIVPKPQPQPNNNNSDDDDDDDDNDNDNDNNKTASAAQTTAAS